MKKLLPVSLSLVCVAGAALAGNNAGTTAYLSWASGNHTTTNTAPAPANNLFIRLERTAPMEFKGVELDLIWTPATSFDNVGCYTRLGTFFQHSSTCTTSGYLFRGSVVPVTTIDDPNHYHMTASADLWSACTQGNACRIQFETDLCVDYGYSSNAGCFTLDECILRDGNDSLDIAMIGGPIATVDGGGGLCPNMPPVISSVLDTIVIALQPLAIAPVASDPDNDALSWSGASLPVGALVDSATGVLTWTPQVDQVGTHAGIVLIANDGNGGTASSSFSIIVLRLPPPFQLVWGTPGPQKWNVEAPSSVAMAPDGTLYVADTGHHRVQQTTVYGSYLFGWGVLGSGQGQFNTPKGLAVDAAGNVYVADTFNNRVQSFTSTGQFVTAWGSFGSGSGQFKSPTGIAVDANGDVFVVDQQNARVQKFTSAGAFLAAWGTFGSGASQFNSPSGIAVAPDGSVFVTDTGNNRVQHFTTTGAYLGSWGTYGTGFSHLDAPSGITVDTSGTVYVADTNNQRVQAFTSTGTVVTAWGAYGATNGLFAFPAGVTTDPAGNVYVADTQNNRVQKFGATPSAVAPPPDPSESAIDNALMITIRPMPLRSGVSEAFVTLRSPTNASWSLFDVRGRRYAAGVLGARSTGVTAIPLPAQLPPGVFVLSVQAGASSSRRVFVVER